MFCWAWQRKEKINGYGDPITKTKKEKKKYIVSYKNGKRISTMIWAANWSSGHTEIYRINRNELVKGVDSPRSYLKIIKDYLPAIWQSDMEFIQNNVPINKATIVKKLVWWEWSSSCWLALIPTRFEPYWAFLDCS